MMNAKRQNTVELRAKYPGSPVIPELCGGGGRRIKNSGQPELKTTVTLPKKKEYTTGYLIYNK